MKTQLWKKKFKARTRLSGLDIKSIVIVARACLEKVNTLLGFNANSRVSNIESDNSQNVGLEDYNNFLIESFHILLPPL